MLFPLKVPTSGEKSTKEEAPKVLMADDPVQPQSTVTWYKRGFFHSPTICIFKDRYAPRRQKTTHTPLFGRKLFKNQHQYQGNLVSLLG